MGGGRGSAAGQPISFSCAKCRICRPDYSRRGDRYELTGKERPQLSSGINLRHWGGTAYQYRCLDCGHVGWSRHPSVKHVASLRNKAAPG